jgi:hypothetical protein
MIRYPITPADLLLSIEAHCPGWIARARTRTGALETGGADPEVLSLWAEIKAVYIDLQHSKCVYCEKKLEDQPIEHDVEHYRPKRKVARWKVPRSLAGQVTSVRQPARGHEPGYRLLAYNPVNYAASCKVCNTILKKNFFPIAGTRDVMGRDPASMTGERPLLPYPIGSLDEDPESLIVFHGLSPRPKAGDFSRQRAQVAIAIFQLNNSRRRGELFEDRARQIITLYLALERRDRASHVRVVRESEKVVRYYTSNRAPHANCLRSFHRLYQSDRTAAERIYRRAVKLLDSYV